METKHEYIIITVVLITMLAVSSTAFFSPVSGYQSMTAEWYQVRWDYPLEFEPNPYTKSLEGAYVTWDGDETDTISLTGGWSDLNAYSASTSDPKFDRNINYNDWWMNDTVSAANPDGDAKHYEWAIDIYTLNVNFATLSGDVGCDAQSNFGFGAEFWLELENNYNSVFDVLGAEDAVSYILYAEVGEYSWVPVEVGNHRVLPMTDKFDIMFLDGTVAVPPQIPETGSDLDFAALEPYSHVAIKFLFADFGKAGTGTDVTVNHVINLNILTIGRFDYALTYVEAGSNEIEPMGDLGLIDGIAASLGAGFGALVDGFTGLTGALVAPLITIAVIVGGVLVIFIILKRR